ncbi:MAG: hypothetical protein ACE5JM_10595 [Armatimonadota bacterium]
MVHRARGGAGFRDESDEPDEALVSIVRETNRETEEWVKAEAGQ